MKSTVISFLLLIISLLAYGQGIPDKSNTVLVDANLFETVRFLKDEGYKVHKLDVNPTSFSTEFKEVKSGDGGVVLMQVVGFTHDDKLKLTANFKPDPGNAVKQEESCYCGEKGSTSKKSFEELNRLAKALSKAEIVYANQ